MSEDGLSGCAGDFFLACAAGDGDAGALRAIEERHIARLPARIRRLGSSAASIPDILQMVRVRLFSGESPRIRAYNASIPLEQWIKVIAIRTAISLHRKESAASAAEAAAPERMVRSSVDAATALMKREHKRELESAMVRLFTQLTPRDRTVFRLHVLQGLRIDKIAKAYGVHRVTVGRWIWNAGEVVLDGLRRHFADQLGIVPVEFDSLARLMRSQLSIDIGRLLQD
jgi:RNA polymerase sigma-70 factor (ECF subfamily)